MAPEASDHSVVTDGNQRGVSGGTQLHFSPRPHSFFIKAGTVAHIHIQDISSFLS